MDRKRVVITGLGAVTPIGLDVPSFWEGLKAGRSGAAPIRQFDASGYTASFACEIKDFDPTSYLEKREARKMDPFSQFGYASAVQAMEDSGLSPGDEPDNIGCIMGTGIGGLWEIENNFDIHRKNPRKVSPFFIPKEMANAVSANIAMKLGIRGPNFVCSSACASASHAMGVAFHMVRAGTCPVIMTGGAESAITPLALAGFCNLRALSTRNDEPEKGSRPFDKDRDGFVMGDGAGVLVFEELEHARARGAKIYAEVFGFGATDDAFHITAPDENGMGATKCMQMALSDGDKTTDVVDYINAHGTSTPVNDPIETKAIRNVFGDKAYKVPVSSTKSMIGHLLGASGAAELVASALMIQNSYIHRTINHENPDPECDLDYVPGEGRKLDIGCMLSNSFGFGGHNATICLGKYVE